MTSEAIMQTNEEALATFVGGLSITQGQLHLLRQLGYVDFNNQDKLTADGRDALRRIGRFDLAAS